jgi:hypothetical protein
MFNSLTMLAVEANGVVALRMLKLMLGGRRARREAELMVREKIDAAFEATAIGNRADMDIKEYQGNNWKLEL